MPVMPEQTKQRRGECVLSTMSNRWRYSLNVTHSMEHIRSFCNFDIYATTNEQETMHFAYTCSHHSHSHSRRTIADRHTACVSNILTFFCIPPRSIATTAYISNTRTHMGFSSFISLTHVRLESVRLAVSLSSEIVQHQFSISFIVQKK